VNAKTASARGRNSGRPRVIGVRLIEKCASLGETRLLMGLPSTGLLCTTQDRGVLSMKSTGAWIQPAPQGGLPDPRKNHRRPEQKPPDRSSWGHQVPGRPGRFRGPHRRDDVSAFHCRRLITIGRKPRRMINAISPATQRARPARSVRSSPVGWSPRNEEIGW